jgi:hypothetical protein
VQASLTWAEYRTWCSDRRAVPGTGSIFKPIARIVGSTVKAIWRGMVWTAGKIWKAIAWIARKTVRAGKSPVVRVFGTIATMFLMWKMRRWLIFLAGEVLPLGRIRKATIKTTGKVLGRSARFVARATQRYRGPGW